MWKNNHQYDPQNQSQKERKMPKDSGLGGKLSVGKLLISLCIGVLTFSLILLVGTGITSIRDVDYVSRYRTEEDYLSYLNSEDYLYLLDLTDRDSRLDKEYSETMLACRAVACYYEAASLYRAYTDAGNMEAAEEQRQNMVEFGAQMGEFSDHAERIHELFQISK